MFETILKSQHHPWFRRDDKVLFVLRFKLFYMQSFCRLLNVVGPFGVDFWLGMVQPAHPHPHRCLIIGVMENTTNEVRSCSQQKQKRKTLLSTSLPFWLATAAARRVRRKVFLFSSPLHCEPNRVNGSQCTESLRPKTEENWIKRPCHKFPIIGYELASCLLALVGLPMALCVMILKLPELDTWVGRMKNCSYFGLNLWREM